MPSGWHSCLIIKTLSTHILGAALFILTLGQILLLRLVVFLKTEFLG